MNDCDYYLRLALLHLHKHWHTPNVGIVAACLWNPETEFYITSTSEQREDGKWVHAEDGVLQAAEILGERDLGGWKIATTLSPCTTDASSRANDPCAWLLSRAGILPEDIHYGALDMNQQPISMETELWTMTRDPRLRHVCYGLYEIFSGHSRTISIFDPLFD